jgi:sugar transferase (PEP-CTERM system associated)
MFRFLRQQTPRWLIILALSEALILMYSVHISMYLRYIWTPDAYQTFSHYLTLKSILFASVVLISMTSLGLYQSHVRETAFGIFLRQGVGFILASILLMLAYYVIPQLYIGRGVFAISMAFGLISVFIFRKWLFSLIDQDMLKRRILVLGAGKRVSAVLNKLQSDSSRHTFNLCGFIPIAGDEVHISSDLILQHTSSLLELTVANDINEILVAPDNRRGSLPMEELLECKCKGIAVTDLTTFMERELGEINLAVSQSWLIFSTGFHGTLLRKGIKRVFDIAMAVVVLALTWPFMLFVSLAIMLESGLKQPVLYSQSRVGEHGDVFNLFKFRSMRTDAEIDGIARWATTNDSRVTRVGKFIRKVRLDELPQLWNVLCGEMSFIGPRPERPEFVQELNKSINYYTLRHSVKPGLTGWAQLRYPYGASEEDAARKLTYDLFYVKNHTLLFDLMIFLQTVEVVLFGRGAR